MGEVFMAPREGSNKISLEGFNHLTWRYKIIPYIRTDNCTDMSNMFSGANYSLPETLDLRAFNTSNVTTMRSMFDNCVSEEILGLDNFNTANVTDMAYMFNASKATELDLSNFDTSKVTTMESMFCNSEVEDLDISNFDTSLVTNMSSMFEGVSSATIDTSNFDTSEVTTMHNMFKGTSGTTLDLSNFDTSNVTDMSEMFKNASYEEIDVSSFDTSQVTTMAEMFRSYSNISSVEELDLSNFDFTNVTDMSYMLSYNNISSLSLPNNFSAPNVTNLTGLFQGLTIPTLDLRGISFPEAESQQYLFNGLNANILDISDWDLGANAAVNIYENMFTNANIHEIRFSNSNNFPEGYAINTMFAYFKTDGILDLSNFNFDRAMNPQGSSMFMNSSINTLIMGDITRNEFANDLRDSAGSGNYSSFFYKTSINLLDMSNSLIEIGKGNNFFDGLVATRINMPNQICVEIGMYDSTYPSYGRAKYVDYSSVDTRNANYTEKQWDYMSKYVTRFNKIVWIPSTFILDGNRTMYSSLEGEVYTDALNYTELGWNAEPAGVTMHYGATHADFEQAILDDSEDWASPSGYPIFFCHTSVPLGSRMTMNQFDSNYEAVYLDDERIEEGYEFHEVGSHTLKVIVDNYSYIQTITVVDHGSSYTVVGAPRDYQWNSTSLTYNYGASTKIECRLYPDKYLFIYPIDRVANWQQYYTTIDSAPSTTITKISGVPFDINRLSLSNCNQLTDISELIVCSNRSTGGVNTWTHGFTPYSMFSGCSRLADVSVVDKWSISVHYTELYNYNNRATQRSGDYNYSSMFYSTAITAAPRININGGSSYVFGYCSNLTDISKLGNFITDGGYSFNSIFYNCSSLSNVSRLKNILKFSGTYNPISLSSFLNGTAVTNTDFIPDEGITVSSIDNMFYNCSHLTDLSGMSRINWPNTAYYFSNAFYGTPATDYSPLSNWNCHFRSISMSNSKMSDLTFMDDWDLQYCTTYEFYNCTNLISISTLSGKINTTESIYMNLNNCSALNSLVGLGDCTFSTLYLQSCTSLTNLNGLQGCTINNCNSLFNGCSSLNNITALSEVTFNVTSIDSMFAGCSSLTNLNGIQGLDISNCTSLSSVFSGCTSLYDLSAIADWNPYQVKNVNGLFYNCSNITSFAAIHNWTTSQLTSMTNTFNGCSSLLNLDGLVGFNPGQCTSLASVFSGCSALTDISDIAYWYVGRCQNMSSMFNGCTSLTSIASLANWNVSALQNAQYMFQGCTSLTSTAGLNNWSVSTLAYTQYMFKGCTSLISITALADWNVVNLSNMSYMFDGDIAITDADSIDVWKNKRTMTGVTRTYAFRNVPTPWPSWA